MVKKEMKIFRPRWRPRKMFPNKKKLEMTANDSDDPRGFPGHHMDPFLCPAD